MNANLPADADDDAADQAPVNEAILLVDDDETVLEFGRIALSRLDREVLIADNGEACLERLRDESSRVSVIVLDMQMPGLSGEDVLREMKQLGVSCPVLMCSGYDFTEQQVQALGAAAFLAKPYRMHEFVQAVTSLLP